MFQRLKLQWSLLLVGTLLFTGCGQSNDPDSLIARGNKENIQRLANLYGGYQSRNGWVGPKDKETFLEFIRSINPKKLERMGIAASEIDGLFISPRDNEEFKIRYGVKGGMGASAPVVFEVTGLDGKRKVAFTAMRKEEVDAERYDLLWSGKGDNAARERSAAPTGR